MNQKNRNLKSSIYNLKSLRQHAFTIHRLRSGFTIVELLVVIVVIGILALISTVSYSGIADRARAASLQADLINAATILEMDKTMTGTYPATKEDANGGLGLIPSSSNTFDYTYNSGTDTYTLTADSGTVAYYITSTNSIPTLAESGSAASSFAMAWGGGDYDYGNSIIQTSDGGYVVVGTTGSYGAGDYDMLISKFNSDGTLSWNKTWGGTGYEWGASVIQTSDGGFAVAGSTDSYTAGGADVFVVKYTSSGVLTWNKTWGSTSLDSASSIAQISDGGLVVVGVTQNFGPGYENMFVAKFTIDGTLSWNKTWGGTNGASGRSVTATTDGGLVVTGGSDNFGAGSSNMYIAKYTSSGILSWDKTWGGTGDEYGISVIQTDDGGLAVAGITNSYGTLSDYDIFIVKYTSDGNLTWNKTWGGASVDEGGFVTQVTDGGLIVTGTTYDFGAGFRDVYTLKFTIDGTFSWNKTWGDANSDEAFSVAKTIDGGFVIAGVTNNYGSGFYDMLVVKFNSSGDISNCFSPMCQSPTTATITTPTATVTSPTATELTPSATVTSPSATVTSPSATTTVIVAP